MSKTDPAALLTHEAIVPDEVRRLHLEPGDTLVVRVTDLTPVQMRDYQEILETWFPEHRVLVVYGAEILVKRPEDDGA